MPGPRKPRGDPRSTKITTDDTGTSAERVGAELPTSKEEIEALFGVAFADAFNRHSLVPGATIRDLEQLPPPHVDFSIKCARADFLELGEIAPRGVEFGRAAAAGDWLDVYQFGYWIYEEIVRAKGDSYDRKIVERTFLLLYPTFEEFFPNDTLIACLQSICFWRGTRFADVFLYWGNPVEPASAPSLAWRLTHLPRVPPPPETFKGRKYKNLPMARANVADGGISFEVQLGPGVPS